MQIQYIKEVKYWLALAEGRGLSRKQTELAQLALITPLVSMKYREDYCCKQRNLKELYFGKSSLKQYG